MRGPLAKFSRWFLALCLLGAVIAAAFSFEAASAQEGIDDAYVDLTVRFVQDNSNKTNYVLEAENMGTADAVGVRVYVILTNQLRSGRFGEGAASHSSIQSNGKGDLEGTWEIGTLKAGVKKGLAIKTTLDKTRNPGGTYMMGRNTAAISSDSGESADLRRNNMAEAWRFGSDAANTRGLVIQGKGGVMVSVDDQNPLPGDSVKFTLVVINLTGGGTSSIVNSIVDVEVSVKLGPGLEFAPGWTPNPSRGTFAKADSSSGTWDVGDLLVPKSDYGMLEIQARLTTESLVAIPLEKRCFSTRVSDMEPPPNPDYAFGRLTACLGDDPLVLFESGNLDIFMLHPCVGVSTSTPPYPCRNENNDNSIDSGLELVVAAAVNDHLALRARGVGDFDRGQATSSPEVMLRPKSVIIQVKDPEGRAVDGSSVTWQTAGGGGNAPGVQARYNWDIVYADGWTQAKFQQLSATGVDGGQRPGSLSMKSTYCDEHDPENCYGEITNADSTGFGDPIDFGDGGVAYSGDFFYELGALGTYLVKREFKGTHSGTEYTAGTSNFVIHVGPIAELGVRDGGASMEVPAGQRAFSIVAVNDGPDDAPAVEVKITGLKADDVQRHSATKGSFNPNSGVWTIGDLKTKEYQRGVSYRDGEVLTIIPDRSAKEDIEVSISNTQDYSVVISGTTHSTKYYDYIEDNDSATVSQHEGTGDLLPTLQVSGLGGAAMLARWTELPSLYRRAIESYEIQRSTDGGKSWTALPGPIIRPVYVDIEARPANNPTYRVRAVNDLNHKGPWSSSLGPAGKPPQGTVEAPGAPLNVGATADGETALDVFWDAPTDEGGAPVTQYEVEWSADGTSGWRTAGYANDPQNRTYKHSGLSSGTTRHYRVAARNSGGRGAWSDPPAFATTLAGVADRPVLTVKSTTPNTIRVRWTEPRDNGGDITSYEIEWSADGSAESWQSLATVRVSDEGFDKREYSDTSVPAGDRRYYRARAINEAGNGRWSDAVSGVTPPGMPTVFRVEPNGPNAILITWSPPDDATDGSTVTSYELEVSTDGGANYSRLSSPGRAARSYNHTGLRPGDTRHYQMRACNGAGCGDWSFPDSATVVPGVPYAPGLTARVNSASEIKLSWNKPNDGGSEITRYQLEHYTDGGDWSALDNNISPGVTEYAHQDPDGDLFGGGTKHRYRVRAVNAMGEGAWSAERSVTISAQAPGKPDLTVAGVQAGEEDIWVDGVVTKRPVYREDSLELSWTAPEDNGSRITGYRVERNDRVEGHDNWVRIGTAGASATSYTDRNLYSGTQYCYRVAANSSAGTGPFSDETCKSTAGDGPRFPDPPIVRLSSVSPNRVTIAWDPPADDGGRPVQSYLYEQAGDDRSFDYGCEYHSGDREYWTDACKMVSAGTRTATFSNLEPGRIYRFRVRAETSYSLSGDWAIVSAHLPAARDDSETDSITEDLQLRVSSALLTVNEGRGQASYRVTLNKAPKEGESVRLDWYYTSARISMDYDAVGNCYDFGDFTHENWSRGCTFTLSAEEDENSDNEIAIMEHSITVGGREVSGPSVRVGIRDND